MSEEKPNNGIDEESNPQEVSLNKVEPDESGIEQQGPIDPEEFRFVLQRLDALGLTWTADIPPMVKPKDARSREVFLNEEYINIQNQYPHFPTELAYAIFYAFTGGRHAGSHIGSQKEADQKASAVREFLDTPEFRNEFFFKYAIKVPYFSDLDWEVVIKTAERNVQKMPGTTYALLSLVFQQPVKATLPFGGFDYSEPERLTVAVNEKLIDKLITSLSEVKRALTKTQQMTRSLSEQYISDEENQNGTDSPKQLE